MAPSTSSSDPVIPDELIPALHEEIARLPERLRLAVVLCDLQGVPQAQAAASLRWGLRTLQRRLAEGRERLQARLDRRGLAWGEAVMTAVRLREAGTIIPPAWREATIRAALDLLNPTVAAGAVSAAAQSLTDEVLKIMLFQTLKWASAIVLAVGAGGIAAATFAVGSNDQPRRQGQPPRAIASKPEPKEDYMKIAEEERKPVPIAGRVLDPDGKPLPAAKIYVRNSHWFDPGEESRAVEQPGVAGPDGRFLIDLNPTKSDAPIGDGPPWHEALIAAVAPGYGPAWIKAGEAAQGGAELRLVRDDLPIRGRFLDTQGRPIANATVRVEWIAATLDGVDRDALLASGKLDWDGITAPTIRRPEWACPVWIGRDGAVTTDAEGRFAISGLGRDLAAVLRIEGPGLEHARIAVLDRTFKNQNPNRRRPPSSKPDMLYQDVKLTLYGTQFEHVVGPTKPITGIVRLKGTGRPVAGVTVAGQIMGRGWTTVMTKTDEIGHYRLEGLPKAESYLLTVRPEPGSAYLDARSVVTDTQGLTPIDVPFELPRAVVVRGRVLDKQTGRALPCNDVTYIPLPQAGENHGFTSAADHTFRVTARPGRGLIVAQLRGRSAPYAAAHLAPGDRGKGIEDAADDPEERGFPFSHFHAYRFVEIPEGTETVSIDLELTPSIIIKGELHGPDGRPVTGVKALGLTANRFATESVETATFDVLGLSPGANAPRRIPARTSRLGRLGHRLGLRSGGPTAGRPARRLWLHCGPTPR